MKAATVKLNLSKQIRLTEVNASDLSEPMTSVGGTALTPSIGKNRLNWAIAPVLMLFHVGALAALFFFTWRALFVAVFLYWVTGSLGLGICYHRLLTHRSYTTPKWFEYFLTICGVVALEGGPLLWVATHRKHHRFADKEGDPHSPRDGKWWAHVGWILFGDALRQDVSILKPYVPD